MDQGCAFSVIVEDRGDRASVQVIGELDLGAGDRWAVALAEARAHPSQHVEVDLSHVTFIDSCGLRLVLRARLDADADAERMTFVNLSPTVERVAVLTGVLDTLVKGDSMQS